MPTRTMKRHGISTAFAATTYSPRNTGNREKLGFGYHPTSGLLDHEVIEPAMEASTTDYLYDAFGNATTATQSVMQPT